MSKQILPAGVEPSIIRGFYTRSFYDPQHGTCCEPCYRDGHALALDDLTRYIVAVKQFRGES